MSKVKCAKCGNKNIAEYLRGMPAFTEQLEEDLEAGYVVLGGCMITKSDPKYHCNNCKKGFGNLPIKINKDGSLFDYVLLSTLFHPPKCKLKSPDFNLKYT